MSRRMRYGMRQVYACSQRAARRTDGTGAGKSRRCTSAPATGPLAGMPRCRTTNCSQLSYAEGRLRRCWCSFNYHLPSSPPSGLPARPRGRHSPALFCENQRTSAQSVFLERFPERIPNLTPDARRGIMPPSTEYAPNGTLIQRGGGTGPLKPRQPGRKRSRCQFRQTDVLEDERAAVPVCVPLPFLNRKGHFFIWRRLK